jgi:hypothetical protein
VLATFAYHVPANYSFAAFQAKSLDYDKHHSVLEAWGEPANVTRAVEAHNEAVRRVAARHGTLFVDMDRELPHGRLCFDDPCHLNAEGCRRFVELIVGALDPAQLGNRSLPRQDGVPRAGP